MKMDEPRSRMRPRIGAALAVLSTGAALTACELFFPTVAIDASDDAGSAGLDAGSLDAAGDALGDAAGLACLDGGCAFHPSGAVTPEDLAAVGASAITLLDPTILHTDTGAIDGVRPAGTGMQSGIGFRVGGGVGIFTFASLTVNAPVVHFTGPNAAALVSAGTIVLNGGLLDVQGSCLDGAPGPGGARGGAASSGPPATPGSGNGAGGAGAGGMGGGGGGAGGIGGAGGAGTSAGGAGGVSYGTPTLVPLLGGSGGGGAGCGGFGAGGGGGGAIQLVAADSILVAGQVNAGGCGAGGLGSGCNNGGGAGGGSGGAILVEAPRVSVSGALAANGGGGGGGGTSAGPGANAGASASRASGGPGSGGSGMTGGAGGAGSAVDGAKGSGYAGVTFTGGGGGAAGRIRINTLAGSATITGTISPSLAASDGGTALATLGTIDLR